MKCFPAGFPLKLDLLEYHVFWVFFDEAFSCESFVLVQKTGVLLQRLNLSRVFDRIVPKIESLTHVDIAPKPLRKVRITYSALFLRVFVYHKFVKIVVVEVFFVTKVLENIFNSYEAIIVSVQQQECFSH